jgi:signal transduction histidine kinase
MQPIVPAKNKTFVPAAAEFVQSWDTFISQILPDYVSGVDCVLSSGNSKFYTYRIADCQATFVGEGDLHDPSFHAHEKTFSVTNLLQSDVAYSISVYPTNEFFNQFHTNTPVYASLISVAVVVLTSLIFFLYDWRISRDAREKDIIMNTKRLFVRYISHEIRTPLNTVHVGLAVLRAEIAALLSMAGLAAHLIPTLSSWLGLITEVEYSSDSATEVLNDMINYDKILTGTTNLEITEVNVWLLVKQCLRPFFVQAKSKNISLSVDMDILRPEVISDGNRLDKMKRLVALADTVKISQVVSNLVSNALKFTPPGGSVEVAGE